MKSIMEKLLNVAKKLAIRLPRKIVMAYFKGYEKLYAEIGDNIKYIRCSL